MKSFTIYTSEQSKIKDIIKDVNYSIYNSSDKNFLSYRRGEKRIHILLDKEDELKLSYDCDSGDITHIDFELSNAMISGIDLNDIKYIDVEYEDDVLTWIIIFLKDTTTAFEIKFTV